MTAARYSIGVDFGGTNLRIAAYSPSSGFLETIQIPARVQAGRDAVVGDMCSGIRKLVDLHSSKFELRGIAIGSPGPLELPEGRLLDASFNGPAWLTGGVLGTEASFLMYPVIALLWLYVWWRYRDNAPLQPQ